MGGISYIFNLHCKGEQKDIENFKAQVEKSVYMSEFIPDISPKSMYCYIEQTRGDVYKNFTPLMEKFPDLSFFFEIMEADNSDTIKWCGYHIYNGNILLSEKRYDFNVNEFDDADEPWEELQNVLTKSYNNNVKPILEKWQG